MSKRRFGSFPGRHVASRIGAAKRDLDRYFDNWEQDQRVIRAVMLLRYDRKLSYDEISKWLRAGPGWCHKTPKQVRTIVENARKEAELLVGGASVGS